MSKNQVTKGKEKTKPGRKRARAKSAALAAQPTQAPVTVQDLWDALRQGQVGRRPRRSKFLKELDSETRRLAHCAVMDARDRAYPAGYEHLKALEPVVARALLIDIQSNVPRIRARAIRLFTQLRKEMSAQLKMEFELAEVAFRFGADEQAVALDRASIEAAKVYDGNPRTSAEALRAARLMSGDDDCDERFE